MTGSQVFIIPESHLLINTRGFFTPSNVTANSQRRTHFGCLRKIFPPLFSFYRFKGRKQQQRLLHKRIIPSVGISVSATLEVIKRLNNEWEKEKED